MRQTKTSKRVGVTPARAAILAAMAFTASISMAMALRAAPWVWSDSWAHTGYLATLVDGQLPTIDTPIPTYDASPNLANRMALTAPSKSGGHPRTEVWVANHPPGAYLPALPGAWWAARSGDGNQILFWQRAANALGATVTVGFAALLARELIGRASGAVVAAGLTAAAPLLTGTGSTGLTDGCSLAAAVAATWAATRIVNRGLDRKTTWIAAAALAACGLTRISSLAVGVAVMAVALLSVAARERRLPWRGSLTILAPTILTSGWFYLRNVLLYGDPAASATLLRRFDRQPNGGVVETATSWSGGPGLGFLGGWDNTVRELLTTFHGDPRVPFVPERDPALPFASTIVLAVLAIAGITVVFALVRGSLRSTSPSPLSGSWVAWSVPAVAAMVTVTTTAQHIAGGGLAHPRYLLILIPIASCVVGGAVCTIARGRPALVVLGLAPVIAYAAMMLLHLGPALDASARRGLLSEDRLGPPSSTAAALGLAGVAAAVYLVAATICFLRAGGTQHLRPLGERA